MQLPPLALQEWKHYTIWKNVPDKDKAVPLPHMDGKKKMWLDSETISKHKVAVAPEFSHLLDDASGPKQKSSESA